MNRDREWSKKNDWKTFEFEETLEVIGISRGRSAANFEAKSTTKNEYYTIFMTDLLDMLKNGSVKKNGIISGTFVIKKRGQNLGVRLKNTPERPPQPKPVWNEEEVAWITKNYPIPLYI